MAIRNLVTLTLTLLLFQQSAYASFMDILAAAKDAGAVIEYEEQPTFLDRVMGIIKQIVWFPLEVLRFVFAPFAVPVKLVMYFFKALLFPFKLMNKE